MKNLFIFAACFLWAAAVMAFADESFADNGSALSPAEAETVVESSATESSEAEKSTSETKLKRASKDAAVKKTAKKAASFFSWSLLWSGSWEENKTFHNRGEVRLNFFPKLALAEHPPSPKIEGSLQNAASFTLRGEVLDRRTINFKLKPFWGDLDKAATNFVGGLYHKFSGSRLLYGVIDEYGLSARLRNPWIRSPPYAEKHVPLMADLKTAASSTKDDEVYLYLSSPVFNLHPNLKLRGFALAQSQVKQLTPAAGGGLDFTFTKKMGLLLETFYTGSLLPAAKGSTWFSNPPPLPQRKFDLYSAGILFYSSLLSLSGDFAYSKTFAWGSGFYANLGLILTPPLPLALARLSGRERPLSVSFAADGVGGRFIYRDGANHGEGFRIAGKIEWKGKGSSLFRLNTVLRSPGFGEDFSRSSSGIYYRFSALKSKTFPLQPTRVSFNMDRNADNPQKINDNFSANMGFSIKLPGKNKKSSLGVNFSGSLKSISVMNEDKTPSPYPFSWDLWQFNSAGGSCELSWSPLFLQFKTKFGYTAYEKKDEAWDLSFYAAARFKYGRISLKAASSDFPEKWVFTLSWRLEKPEKR